MPDPQILTLTGVEIEIRLWRGTTNVLDAYLLKADGSALPLGSYDATFVLLDKPGGTVQHTETKIPGQHMDEAAGWTRFSVPGDVFDALTGQRQYTWKYHVFSRHRTTNAKHIHFWGDARVQAPFTPV